MVTCTVAPPAGCTAADVQRRRRGLRSVPAVTLLACLLVATGCTRTPTLSGVVRTDPLDVGTVRLLDVTEEGLRGGLPIDGEGRVAMVAPEQGLLLVSFGFLNCPDVCPTTLADVRSAVGRLEARDAARIDLVFITVDPDRDGPEELTAYLRHFMPRFHALREPGEALDAALEAFLASARVEVAADGSVEVSHTAVLYAVDDRGLVVVEWPFGTSAASIADDLEVLLDRAAGGTS
jgi:protein SCO1/2